MDEQLLLPLPLRLDATFANYVVGGNRQVVTWLQEAVAPPYAPWLLGYIWGTGGKGRTHLLWALIGEAERQGLRSAYLPLRQGIDCAAALEGLEACSVIAIDDIEYLETNWEAQEALFHAYNRWIECPPKCVVITSSKAPTTLAVFPDLHSRLMTALVFHLESLNDEDTIEALRIRAQDRGIVLDPGVAAFLVRRLPRDLGVLCNALWQLDSASLMHQRVVTIPFAKKVLKL